MISLLEDLIYNNESLEKVLEDGKDIYSNNSTINIDFIIENKKLIDSLLDNLTDKEKKVIMLRYGLIDGKRYSLHETGKQMNLSHESIRLIEGYALGKLRSMAKNSKDKYLSNEDSVQEDYMDEHNIKR